MSSSSDHLVHVGTLERLRAEGCVVVRGADRSICVWYNEGNPVAVDNRCPHMGFPLSRGSIHDGIITCHWHHARFDAASGCTFDLFADDVPAFDVQIRDQDVYVQAHPRRRDPVVHARRRLTEGMQLNLPLTCAKAILDLRTHGVGDTAIVQQIAEYGAEHRDGWGPGMTVLTCVAQLLPDLGDATRYEGLYQAARRVAAAMHPRLGGNGVATGSQKRRWCR